MDGESIHTSLLVNQVPFLRYDVCRHFYGVMFRSHVVTHIFEKKDRISMT